MMDVSFRRVPPRAPGAGESLQVVSGKGVLVRLLPNGQKESIPISEKDIELKLCTLQHGNQYWLDTGRFEVIWPDGANA